jgi:hypothetical protein
MCHECVLISSRDNCFAISAGVDFSLQSCLLARTSKAAPFRAYVHTQITERQKTKVYETSHIPLNARKCGLEWKRISPTHTHTQGNRQCIFNQPLPLPQVTTRLHILVHKPRVPTKSEVLFSQSAFVSHPYCQSLE